MERLPRWSARGKRRVTPLCHGRARSNRDFHSHSHATCQSGVAGRALPAAVQGGASMECAWQAQRDTALPRTRPLESRLSSALPRALPKRRGGQSPSRRSPKRQVSICTQTEMRPKTGGRPPERGLPSAGTCLAEEEREVPGRWIAAAVLRDETPLENAKSARLSGTPPALRDLCRRPGTGQVVNCGRRNGPLGFWVTR